jgi:hypothetical protein
MSATGVMKRLKALLSGRSSTESFPFFQNGTQKARARVTTICERVETKWDEGVVVALCSRLFGCP